MKGRISYEGRMFALFVALLCSLVLAVGMTQAGERDNSAVGSAAVVEAVPPEPMEFWPRRISSDHTPEIYVQLSHPVREPLATIVCETREFELGTPIYSHRQRLLHSFDMSPVPKGLDASCELSIRTATGEVFASPHALTVRARETPVRVSEVLPRTMSAADEGSLAITGARFSDLVNVVWISANEFRVFERSARVRDATAGDSVIVPFSPLTCQAPPGEYLVVVENKNRSAAIYDGWFIVSPALDPEIESVRVSETEGVTRLLVSGFNLEGISGASLDLPAGQLPVAIRRNEGSLVPSITISLPPFTPSEGLKLSNLSVVGDQLSITISGDSKLTQH